MLFKLLAKKIGCVLFTLIILCKGYAQKNDSLSILFNQYQFAVGEMIIIEATIDNYDSLKATPQTLHLWIDNLNTGKRQKYKYAMLNGYLKFVIEIDSTISNGKYAFNFLLDKRFLTINGKVEKGINEAKSINYVASAKKKASVINDVTINADSSFTIKDFYFLDMALFTFSPTKKSKENSLQINISTPLDSVFTPLSTVTEFITIGKDSETENKNSNGDAYSFVQYKVDKKTLQEVIVIGKKKTEAEKFDEKNSKGIFTMGDPKVIDFLSTEDHLTYPDIYTYLQAVLPGIQVVSNSNNGQPLLRWRNETVDIYVDEVYEEDFNPNTISMQDVAIVKVYRQSYRLTGGAMGNGFGGSIAIYTKRRNNYTSNKLSNYTFYIKGYNNLYNIWKNN
jgi:hypothetical protein